jgi:hypothetical protein
MPTTQKKTKQKFHFFNILNSFIHVTIICAQLTKTSKKTQKIMNEFLLHANTKPPHVTKAPKKTPPKKNLDFF